MNRATSQGLLRSSHTPTLGGLAVAFALASVGGDLGAEIDLASVPCSGALDDDRKLFSESHSRFVLTCAPGKEAALESVFQGLPCIRVGTVAVERRMRIRGEGGRLVVDTDIESLRHAFRSTLDGV